MGIENKKSWNIDIEKSPKYDAWLHWNVTNRCNLACSYCNTRPSNKMRIEQMKNLGIKNIHHALVRGLKEKFEKPPKEIDINVLISTLDKTNKIFRIGFTGGGEPFTIPNLVYTCIELTKKHYIAVNSNLTNKNVKEFAENIDPKRVIHFHASLHIKELERTNLLDRYIDNFLLLKEREFGIFAREVGHPTLLGEIEKYRRFFKEKGIELIFGPFYGEYNGMIYPDAYTKQDIKMFGLEDLDTIKHFFHNKGKICNAGYNAGIVSNTGDIQPCHLINNNMGNIYKEIKFTNKLIRCPFEFCPCPIKNYDNYLFKKAIEENTSAN